MNEKIEFNKEKFKDLIHYIISKCEDKTIVEKAILIEILYFSDFNYYEIYEKSLTGEKYIRKPRCPIPKDFDTAIYELERKNKIKVVKTKDYTKYISLNIVKLNILTKKELKLVNDVIEKISNMNSVQTIEYTQEIYLGKLLNHVKN